MLKRDSVAVSGGSYEPLDNESAFKSSVDSSRASNIVQPSEAAEKASSAALQTFHNSGNFQLTVSQVVGHDLAKVELAIKRICQSKHAEVQILSDYGSQLGGKRLRPILAILCSKIVADECSSKKLARSSKTNDLHRVAAAVELVHAASLVHDDVLDQAETRRHQPTAGVRVGNHSAILLGDYLFTKAYEMASRCRDSYPARRLARAASMLCEGELRQQQTMGRWNTPISTYLDVLAQKTGALCSVSCRLGAWSASSSAIDSARRLSRYGMQLGLAFQLFDDWLDYWGTDKVGKTLGTDLDQRKPTLPLLRLLATSEFSHRQELISLLGDQSAGDKQKREIVKRLESSDASEYTLDMATRSANSAIEQLRDLPDSAAKLCLERIARFSVSRVA